MDTVSVVETYVRAWHEDSEAARRELFEKTWADDGVYADPTTTIEGREALLARVAEFRKNRPDVRIEIRSRIDAFGNHFRFLWATVDGSDTVLNEGIDFGQLDDEGRIAFVTGFFGPLS